jgi:3-dehydrosphinganine reductase
MDFQGIRALVTGGSSGIGLALARQLAAEGAHVWILARDDERLSRAAETIRAARASADQRVETISVDVADAGAVQAALTPLTAQDLLPDLLINCAGAAHPGYAEELGLDIYHWMMDVNYFGTVHVTQALLPAMVQRGSGHIAFVSSMAGYLGVFGYAAYGASKFAVKGYSDTLREEMRSKGIDISIAYPPDTRTPQYDYENKFKPPETQALSGNVPPMEADAVAEGILKGIARHRYAIVLGSEGKLAYWLSWLLGNPLYVLMDFYVARARAEARKAARAGAASADSGGE